MRLMALAISVVGLCSLSWAAEKDKTSERLDDAADLFNEFQPDANSMRLIREIKFHSDSPSDLPQHTKEPAIAPPR